MVIRCKVRLAGVDNKANGGMVDGKVQILHNLYFEFVMDGSPENKEFFKWSPGGEVKMYTVNPAVIKELEIGKEYYMDFTEAPTVQKS